MFVGMRVWRAMLISAILTAASAQMLETSKGVAVNGRITYFEVTAQNDTTWQKASQHCMASGMELCMKKDICVFSRRSSSDVPRQFVKRDGKIKHVPVGDAYNDWLNLGPRRLTQCRRLTKVSGPPLWKGKECTDAIRPSRPFRNFCQSRNGIYCCRRSSKPVNLLPRPVTVYINRYQHDNKMFYSFSLNAETNPKTLDTLLAGNNKYSQDVKTFSLMSTIVPGKFEDPIYVCSRSIKQPNGASTEYFYVSNIWCYWGWKLNFYLYGSLTNIPNSQRYEANAADFGKRLRSRLSVNGTISRLPGSFSFYGPKFDDGSHIELYSNKEPKATCSKESVLLTAERGTIESEVTPNSQRVTCRWKVRASSNGVVKFTFTKMNLSTTDESFKADVAGVSNNEYVATGMSNKNCSEERLEIFGYGSFCGKALPPTFVTKDNEIEIVFIVNRRRDQKRYSVFSLSYQTIIPPNGLVRKRLDDATLTWQDANQTCANAGKTLCKSSDICQRKSSQPFYGVQKDDQWTPIIDDFNNWLQIGNGNVQPCKRHNDILGPPLWGISKTECNTSNEHLPCPRRDYVYCCASNRNSSLTRNPEFIDVLIYTTLYRGIVFSKYLRKGIDSASSFDDMKLAWTPRRKRRGDYVMMRLSSEYSATFDKPVYFCQREVVPAMGRVRFAYSVQIHPCESQGWKYLYHLYGMSTNNPSAIRYYVGIYEKRPHHSRIHIGSFPATFRKDNSYILYSYGLRLPSTVQNAGSNEELPPCDGSIFTVTAPTVIISPGYPKSYKPQSNCRWIIKKPANSDGILRLTVKELDLEDPVDILTIRAMSASISNHRRNVESDRIRTLSGIVSQLTMKTDGYFELNFTSDATVSKKGFRIVADIISTECGGDVRVTGGLITSPNYPSQYPFNSKCMWSIEAPSENYEIQINVITLDLTDDGNCTDKVVVSSFDTVTNLCGQNTLADNIRINASTALIQFHSLKPKVKSERFGKGFALQVIFLERPSSRRPHCGVQSIPFGYADPVSDRIVGGSRATLENFPWMIHVQSNSSFCSGTLNSKSWVMTAAHCLLTTKTTIDGRVVGGLKYDPELVRIIVGRKKFNASNPGEQIRRISHLQFRNDYLKITNLEIVNGALKFSTFSINDILLLKMDKEVTFTSSVQPICLPIQDAHVSDTCYIAGWGKIKEGDRDTDLLHYAKAPILETGLCNKYPRMRDSVEDSGLCAGYPAGGSGMCNGDSGGPLFCRGKYGNYYIQGITSWSVGCARKNLPGVYTRVHYFIDWIKNAIAGDLPDKVENLSSNITISFTKT